MSTEAQAGSSTMDESQQKTKQPIECECELEEDEGDLPQEECQDEDVQDVQVIPCPEESQTPPDQGPQKARHGPENFPEELVHQYYPLHENLSGGYNTLPTYGKDVSEYKLKRSLSLKCPKMAAKWDLFQQQYPNNLRKLMVPGDTNARFIKYDVRNETGEPRTSFGMKLKPGPLLDCRSQFPIPGNILNTHRTLKNIKPK